MSKLKKFMVGYARTPNSLINDKTISLKAKGLFAYIESKPDDWDFSAKRISNSLKEGIDAINDALKELEIAGYLIRQRYQDDSGFWKALYILTDKILYMENPIQENPYTGKSPNITKKEITKKDINKERNNYANKKQLTNNRNYEAYNLAKKLANNTKETYDFIKIDEEKINSWAVDIEKINRLDGYDYKVIGAVIDWVHSDDFWKQNIRSGIKLRKQFETLLVKIKSQPKRMVVIS